MEMENPSSLSSNAKHTWSIFTTSVHLLTRWSRWQLSCPYTPIHIYNYFTDKLRSFAGRWCANTYIMYFFKPLEKKEQKASSVLVITSQSWKSIRFWQKCFFFLQQILSHFHFVTKQFCPRSVWKSKCIKKIGDKEATNQGYQSGLFEKHLKSSEISRFWCVGNNLQLTSFIFQTTIFFPRNSFQKCTDREAAAVQHSWKILGNKKECHSFILFVAIKSEIRVWDRKVGKKDKTYFTTFSFKVTDNLNNRGNES